MKKSDKLLTASIISFIISIFPLNIGIFGLKSLISQILDTSKVTRDLDTILNFIVNTMSIVYIFIGIIGLTMAIISIVLLIKNIKQKENSSKIVLFLEIIFYIILIIKN